MKHETTQQIDRLIRARYPVIAVQSHEENRVIEHIAQIAQTRGKALFAWSVSRGIRQIHPEPDDDATAQELAQLTDSLAALKHVVSAGEPTDEHPNGPPAIYVFQDLHPWLAGDRADHVVIRALRDVSATLIKRHQTVILLSPNVEIPQDAEKDVVLVDFPLPTPEELAEQVESFIANLPAGIDCELNGGRRDVIRALQGLTAVEADAVLAQAVVSLGHLDTDAIPFILDAKSEIIRKSGALEYYPEQANYADIGGLDLLKAWCAESEIAFTDDAQAFGVEPDRGVLIVGVPGCGKSLTAKAIAGGTRPLLRLDVGALFGSLVGQSEAQTRNALKVAEAVAPCVLWIDELEKALGGVGGGEMDGGTSTRVLGTILTWMEETTAPVFIAATANDISSLRPELIRRFSENFFVDLPQAAERADILAIHLRKRGRGPENFNLEKVAAATKDFTGSELEKVVQGAIRRAFVADGSVTTGDLLAAAGDMVPLATTMERGISKMRHWAKRARPASSRQETGRKAEDGRALEL